jgi:hypothetical protein
MVRSSKLALLPALILFALFMGGLVAIHIYVDSAIGRSIADFAVVVLFFGGILVWVNK